MKHILSSELYGTLDQRVGGVYVVETERDAHELLVFLRESSSPVGIDCETEDIDVTKQSPVGNGHIVCWSVAWTVDQLAGPAIYRAYIPAEFLPVFKDYLAQAPLVGHNIWQFDRHMFNNHGIELHNIVADTLRMSQMLYNVKGYDHGLKALATRYLGYQMRDYAATFSRPKPGKLKTYKRTSFRLPGKKAVLQLRSWFGGECQGIQWARKEILRLSEVKRDYPALAAVLVDYASLDAKATLELYYKLKARLEVLPARAQTSEQLYTSFWNPLCEVVSNSEMRGILLDPEVCHKGQLLAEADVSSYTSQLSRWVGPEFNWGSPAQLKTLFYDEMGMDPAPIKGTLNAVKAVDYGERSVAEASLYWLELNAPGPAEKEMLGLVRKRRKTLRLLGYLRDLPNFRAADGRIHCIMGPDTRTGRLSAKCPPLQQMPSRGNTYGIRRAFVARPGYKLIVADYSQLEVYVLAHMLIKLFGDYSIANALASGDVYGSIAKLCWPTLLEGIAPTDIKKHANPEVKRARDLAKIVVLATNYGKTPQGLAISLLDETGQSVGLEYANNLLATYEAAFPGVVKFQHWTADFATKHRGIYTLAGRWRPIPEANADQAYMRRRGHRIASNTPIQGSAMDLTAAAMIDIENDYELFDSGAEQLLQIHDEIIVEVPDYAAERALLNVSGLMTKPRFDMEVTLKVEAKIADSWEEGKS